MSLPSRDEAFQLLCEHTRNPNLIKHMLAVEAAMRAYARRFGQNEDLWGITGLLHDYDYEKHPDPEEHPMVGVRILTEKGYPPDVIHAIKSHATYLGVPRDSLLDKALFAADELTGFSIRVGRPENFVRTQEVETERIRAGRQPGGHPHGGIGTRGGPGRTHCIRAGCNGRHRAGTWPLEAVLKPPAIFARAEQGITAPDRNRVRLP